MFEQIQSISKLALLMIETAETLSLILAPIEISGKEKVYAIHGLSHEMCIFELTASGQKALYIGSYDFENEVNDVSTPDIVQILYRKDRLKILYDSEKPWSKDDSKISEMISISNAIGDFFTLGIVKKRYEGILVHLHDTKYEKTYRFGFDGRLQSISNHLQDESTPGKIFEPAPFRSV